VQRELAECWARSALASPDRREQVDRVARGWEIDHRSPLVRDAARRIGVALFDAGERARAREDWEEAYRLFADAVRADPTLAWARRYAEEARRHRLASAARGSQLPDPKASPATGRDPDPLRTAPVRDAADAPGTAAAEAGLSRSPAPAA
jgi:lambda repressor-like predicted transcriptional regulator